MFGSFFPFASDSRKTQMSATRVSEVVISRPQAPQRTHQISVLRASKADWIDANDGRLAYIAASAGQYSSYLLRSDGAVDKVSGGRGVAKTYDPVDMEDPYVGASAGPIASYLLHESGAVDRVTGFQGVISRTYDQVKYTAVSAGASSSYLLRDDGTCDCMRSVDNLVPMGPKDGADTVKYTMVGAGSEASYLLRSDGAVHRTRGSGQVDTTFRCDASPYVAISTQIAAVKNDKGGGGATATYLVRKDGKVDRVRTFGDVCQTLWPPEGLKYIAASAADMVSYLLRSDGAVDRVVGKLKGGAKVDCTINPPPGVKYVGVSAGQWASYLLRDDGCVDRTTNGGKITATLAPSPAGAPPPESGGCCAVM